MSGRLGTREADELIEQKLQRSMQLHAAMAQTIDLDDDGLYWPLDGAWRLSSRPHGPRQPKHRDRHASYAV